MTDFLDRIKPDGNIYDTLCEDYVLASVLYYSHGFSAVPDSRFDNWCQTLCMKYSETPEWFRERVSRADLIAGTGYKVKPTPEEEKLIASILSGEISADRYF